MNKKVFFIILLFIVIGVLFYAFFAPNSDEITPEEAEKLCYSILGEKDADTGFPFSFGTTGTYEKDGKQYYLIRASWLVNNNHMSYIGDFFVTLDGKEIYNGFAGKDEYTIENLIWSK